MRVWPRAAAVGVLAAAVVAGGCRNPFGRQYEYEEELYLNVNGAATVIVDASIPALVALRHLPLDPAFGARVDRDRIRQIYEAAGCRDVRVGEPWVRRGRHFVQVRVEAEQITDLSSCGPLSWSTYRLTHEGQTLHFEQVVGPPDPAATPVPSAGWNGSELVAFRIHVPSRITYHNVKVLDTGENGQPDRGNILTWEQHLSDRLAGKTLDLDVKMDAESILRRTLLLFVGAFGAAVLALAGAIWLMLRRAKRRKPLGKPQVTVHR